MKQLLPIMLVGLLLAACATIAEGTTQDIRVEVVPNSGTCILSRSGEQIGVSTPDRRIVNVSKSMNDINFRCSASGYRDKEELLSSSLSPATVASFLLLDFGIIDAATGAWKKYPERLTIVLDPIAPDPRPPSTRPKSAPKV